MDEIDREPEKPRDTDNYWHKKRDDRFYLNTKERKVYRSIQRIVRELEPGIAIEFGPGAGIETKFLLENGWNVKCVDIFEESEKRIQDNLSEEEKLRFNFEKSEFESIDLEREKYDLAVGYNSLHFCRKDHFPEFFEKITDSLKSGGILMCNLLGQNDEWVKNRNNMTFFSKEELNSLLEKNYEVEVLKEIENDGIKADGTPKHWHIFTIRARKKAS